jgi:O-antigen ligase
MKAAAAPLAAGTGVLAALLHNAGALKSTPPLATLPFDLTLAAAALLLPAVALLAATRRWFVAPPLVWPLLGAALLWFWMVLAGSWSASRLVLAAKLPELALGGPAMLLAGLVVGAEDTARQRFCDAGIAVGLLVAAGLGWGLLRGGLVMGGTLPVAPELVRVQYQLVGLAMAGAAGLCALRLVEAERAAARLVWLLLAAALAGAMLLPGGRTALLAMVLAVAVAPALRLGLSQRPVAALLWLGGMGALSALPLLWLSLDPAGAQAGALGLRTLERLVEGADDDLATRLSLWAEAGRWAAETLPLGLGTGGFSIAAGFGERRGLYPHNHALEAFSEGGLPGLLLWLLAFGGAALVAVRLAPRLAPGRAGRIAAVVLPVALSVMVSTDLGNRMAWFVLGFALSLGLEARRA